MSRVWVWAFLLLLAVCGGCKKKEAPLRSGPFGNHQFKELCNGEKSDVDWTKVKPLSAHPDGSASPAIVFLSKSKNDGRFEDESALPSAMKSSTPLENELTVCVDGIEAKPPLKCDVIGSPLSVVARRYHVKVIESSSGKVLADEDMETDGTHEPCDPKTKGDTIEVDYRPVLARIVARFEPESVKLPPPSHAAIYDVCNGRGIFRAKTTGATRVVYMPEPGARASTVDWPDGLSAVIGTEEQDDSSYAHVLCVTAKPTKQKRSCNYLGFGAAPTQQLYDGTFDAELRETATGKVVETKTFKGTSTTCPEYARGGSTKRITTIDKPFAAYASTLGAR